MAAMLVSREGIGSSLTKTDKAAGASATVKVRRAQHSDYPAIEIFLREAYGALAPFKIRQRWDWQFKNNPYGTSRLGFVAVWIAEVSGKVVGQIAVQEGIIKIDDATQPAGWIVDVMILPSYRGLGLGHQLYAAVAKECPFLVTLTMALATRRMAENLGAVEFGKVRLYSRLLHFDHQIGRRYIRMRTRYRPRIARIAEGLCDYFVADRLLAHVGNLLIALRNVFAPSPRAKKQTEIVEVQRFGPEVDLLWQRVCEDFPVAFARDSKFLNWRFCDCPQMNYRRFVAFRNTSVAGYLVLRQTHQVELPQGIIVDFLAARRDRETVEDLISFALESFGTKVAAVECASSVREFTEVLRKFGFHPVRTERPNAVVADEKLRKRLDGSASEWLLSKADHDWDQVRPA